MLRRISLVAAVTTLLAIPTAGAMARPMGGHGMHMGGFHHFGGVHHVAFHRHAFFPRHRVFFARHHFRHRGVFIASAGLYGGSCWHWRPTPWGWRRVWVCDNGYY